MCDIYTCTHKIFPVSAHGVCVDPLPGNLGVVIQAAKTAVKGRDCKESSQQMHTMGKLVKEDVFTPEICDYGLLLRKGLLIGMVVVLLLRGVLCAFLGPLSFNENSFRGPPQE